MGGDAVHGLGFIECLELFEADPETEAVALIGEIGGDDEERAAAFVRESMTKPVVAYVAGLSAPPGRRMGHAGAIVEGSVGTAADQEGRPRGGRHPGGGGSVRPRAPAGRGHHEEKNDMTQLVVGDAPLTIDEVIAVARGGAEVSLGRAARERIEAAHDVVAAVIANEQVAYGVTTGFGLLATTHIPVDKVRELQENLVRSHAVGLGEPLSREVVRAAMVIRLNTMARGHSGVRLSVAEHLAACINADFVPWVPSRGSLGASGDLAPSAHLVLAMMGEGELLTEDGRREPSGPALQAAGLAPLSLEAKEGLSLLNGTQFMAAIGCMLVADGEALLDSADLIGAMSLEGLRASVGPFEERIQALRPIPGQLVTAANVRRATTGSAIMLSHLNCDKVQDAYSLRCIPQVHGACRDALAWLRRVVGVEVDSVTDNPLDLPGVRRDHLGRQLPRRAARAGARPGGDEPLGDRLHQRAPHLPHAHQLAQRAAAVPHHRQRPQQRLHDRPVHRRGAGQREQGAVPPGERGLDPELRRPGGPRQHGHDGGAQGARRARQRAEGARHRGRLRGAGHRPAGAAGARLRYRRRAGRRARVRADARAGQVPRARARGGGRSRRRRPLRRHRARRSGRGEGAER